jgi:hypothetical protein
MITAVPINAGKRRIEEKFIMDEISKTSSQVKYILKNARNAILEKLLKDFGWINKFNIEKSALETNCSLLK